jgi:hypothetical protein
MRQVKIGAYRIEVSKNEAEHTKKLQALAPSMRQDLFNVWLAMSPNADCKERRLSVGKALGLELPV